MLIVLGLFSKVEYVVSVVLWGDFDYIFSIVFL